jgi:selenide,water dikinase
LSGLPKVEDPRLLVGFNTADDAGVFLLNEETALIQTVDFFTPVVDDPFIFGQVAAANALSDVYAMGGEPLTAMNIVGFPCGGDLDALKEILRGGGLKVAEAGAILVGGHTVQDREPKYGLAVTGIAKPGDVVTNAAARCGDVLVLTKPIGTGVLTTALKGDCVPADAMEYAAKVMTTLNRRAAHAMREAGVRAATDITGFGLLGHLAEMAEASGVTAELSVRQVPLLPQALDQAVMGLVPAGAHRNREYLEGRVSLQAEIPKALEYLLYDPQTSGGLLMAVSQESLPRLIAALQPTPEEPWSAAVVGRVTQRGSSPIRLA